MADPLVVPRFTPKSRLFDFFQGLSLPFSATRLIFRSRKLFLLAGLSSVVTGGALIGLFVGLWRWTPQLLASVWAAPETWYGKAAWSMVLAVTFLVMFVVGANTIPLLLLAPLQDPMSEATEELCGDFRSPPFSLAGTARQVATSVGHTVARIGGLLLGHALLFTLNFIPGVGSFAWSFLAALWTMGWLAAEYLDGPMARHLYAFRTVRRVVWERLPLCMGFGAAIHVMLWVPVLNFFFIPAAVVGGTLLFRGLRACGALPVPGQSR